ncbi:MAG: FGGY family carbohydrate kinase, partial [Candidatus Thorarchaeota archaeon]
MTEYSGDRTFLLAVDHGTSAMKVALTDKCGEVLAFEFVETPLHLKAGGGAEQDPSDWWNAFVECSTKLVQGGTVRPEQIAGICVSSQWSGTVAVDEAGNHLWKAIIWMDTRGKPYISKKLRGIINIQGYGLLNILRWLRKTAGIPANSGKDPIAHILWLQNEHPEIYDQTFNFLECKDYLNLKLTGKFAASYDSIMLH